MKILFYISLFLFLLNGFIVFYAMVGYPLALKIINKLKKPKENKKALDYEPNITYMIVAHNEEKVILSKLDNAINLDYPNKKIQIIVASDNSTDNTNEMVKMFIESHPEFSIVLHCSKEHKGKTNAQNEAQKIATGEILVMTDANTMLKKDAIRELVSSFSDKDIVYVCGKLVYSNSEDQTGDSESTYWDLDLSMRDIESKIKTITAGNGALYACRNKEYIDFDPILCHDSAMPFVYSKQGKRAIFNQCAIAVEKAGDNNKDEYKRKVRMNRDILKMLGWGLSVLNIFKYKWFAFFYFGHRTCRYSLWLAHIILLLSALCMTISGSLLGGLLLVGQVVFFILAAIALKFNIKFKVLRMAGYYAMTVFAQIHGVYNIITGKSKPIWEKAESTR